MTTGQRHLPLASLRFTTFLAALLLAACGGSESGATSNATSGETPRQEERPDEVADDTPAEPRDGPRQVIFVGNNWEGMIDVIDAQTYQRLGRINGIPDQQAREQAIASNPLDLLFFQGIRVLIGEGHHQYVDDMYSSTDGRLLIVSRPSYADVVAIDVASGEIAWRFKVDGYRSDHMALSPDGRQVAVSASTGNVVHLLDVETGEEQGRFASGDSPHENVYSDDGQRIYHASIGTVYTPLDNKLVGDLTDGLLGQNLLDATKGERVFQVVDANSLEIIKRLDLAADLEAAGYGNLSTAVRPMAHTSNERYFYFQLSFLHGFIEYDMQEEKVLRLVELPDLTNGLPRALYVNDSAHHGIAMSDDDKTLCVAGTMSDYVALVDRRSSQYQLKTGIGEKPYWVTTSEDGEHCYVSWSGTDQMSVFHYASGEEVARVNVGDHPQRIREGSVPERWVAEQDSVFLP
ncbi:serine/threonine protein kinase [Alcanivorax hongdengensis A-11-3]|uniref:Serine/threonine protein kinase n=1 Tax=Alcanivorax hongdengensis A-11-3 TaxID=1177179 RepID=L0WB29_9GAMM|nr:PQQ-binding-like beta-propeller repeat protein [Alcanivorax hongdengensis]EKF73958.1 serine/threonine protein kinase [Alcanivorax hongdengensis A-11-3]